MTVIKLPALPDVPFRIRSADRTLYLEWQTNGDILAVPLVEDNKRQQWRAADQGDGTYRLLNVEGGEYMGTTTYSDSTSGAIRYRISAGGRQTWILNFSADQVIIVNPRNALCVDIAVNNFVQLWERWDAPNQRWIFESIQPIDTDPTDPSDPSLPKPVLVLNAGSYDLVNVLTGLYTRATTNPSGKTNVMIGLAKTRIQPGLWSVMPQSQGNRSFQIYFADGGQRFYLATFDAAAQSTGARPYARADTGARACRVLPVAGSAGYFNILVDTAGGAKALHDPSSPGSGGLVVLLQDFDPSEKRQQWLFSNS